MPLISDKQNAKGKLLKPERLSLTKQKVTFYDRKGNLLQYVEN